MEVSELGNVFALIGAALAVSLPAIGSAIGTGWVQQSVAGIISEQPNKFGRTLILQLVPSSNALYGLIVGFLILNNAVLAGGDGYTAVEGLAILAICIPIALVGLVACLMQAKVCVAGVRMVGKRMELSGRALTMAVFIELFALFALIISVLGVLNIGT
ncbi:MAG: V-type ATP synthase subunit K [Firmicutes bacterium]|nr:V-type ATP synthase subunit K [Bacillota bacterium]